MGVAVFLAALYYAFVLRAAAGRGR
jgi:hypothetical protein